ncbi:MAG TPA: serine/threonine-protein kinase [Streptosporangiaceae bacterium]|nr:serine/threonine-protein kinase [Streptosporangiaceae bacterium]
MKHELRPGDPELIGPYRLRGRLGTGGMGRVYLGLSPGGRAAAIKVIRSELAQDPEFRARFRREVAVARQVSGLYTAPVLDADADGPEPWLATAYVPGPSLADAVSQHGPLPAPSVLMLAAGLAEALSAIHGAGVVHRDLKPANVLLADDGPRVIDFGISRAAEGSSLTHTGLVVGSPGFMSPEQAEGREVGPPSDIFSLGTVLAFAATGRGPFGSGSTPALVYRVVHDVPQLDLVPAEIRPLIERCLAKDPAGRPTAAGLLAGAALGVPGQDWLPEPVTRTFRRDEVPAAMDELPAAMTATDLAVAGLGGAASLGAAGNLAAAAVPATLPGWGAIGSGAASADGATPPGGTGRQQRRVRWRPFAVAAVLAAVVGGGSGAAFALTGAPAHAVPSARQIAAATTAPAAAAPSGMPSAAAASSSPASPSPASSSPSAGSPPTAAPSYAPPTDPAPSYAPSSTAPSSASPPASPSPSSPPPSSAPPSPVTSSSPSSSSPGATPPPASFPDVSSPAGGWPNSWRSI